MTATTHLAPVWYRVTELDVVRGEGSWVHTADGHRYLDYTAGIAVASTGHCHPAVVEAIRRQAGRFIHSQVNCYRHDLLEAVATALANVLPPGVDTLFFANSGGEITEAAVKLARQATGRPNVVVLAGGFHGRTHLGMAMSTSKTVFRSGHTPLPSGVFVAPFPDPMLAERSEVSRALAGLDRLFETQTAPAETACLLVEPVLGEGGYVPCPPAFLEGVAERCRAHGVLLVADEVQSGFGRTGRMFAIEHYAVTPDMVCMGKGIASGFPFAALGARRDLADRWPVGSHGGTFGGNPMGCAAALATLDVLTAPGFLDAVASKGAHLRQLLDAVAARDEGIRQVRGLGLMLGTELGDPARAAGVQAHMREHGRVLVMTAGTRGETIRWMPPLVTTDDEIEHAVAAFDAALAATKEGRAR